MPEAADGSFSDPSKHCLELGEGLFDRIEVGTVGRQEAQGRAGLLTSAQATSRSLFQRPPSLLRTQSSTASSRARTGLMSRTILNGEMRYLWRAVDHEGEVLESFVTKERDKAAALKFMKKALKRHGSPEAITTDGLRSYKAAMSELGNAYKQEVGRWANNRVENSHLPFRRRERAMLKFRRIGCLQKFASVHANVHNHFNTQRHLVDRPTFKLLRSVALAEWRSLMA